MRVLILVTGKTGRCRTEEIVALGYENYQGKTGLMIYTSREYNYLIQNVSSEECTALCEHILRHGYIDLRRYGECEYLPKVADKEFDNE